MITITDKRDCCGCSACVLRCPRHCITLQEDSEGFLYPFVDVSTCVNCGLCESVCPMQHLSDRHELLQSFAAASYDEGIRQRSSSGGIFSLLAKNILKQGGVVFGARFDAQWQVTLDYTENLEGLTAFCGSKYVQARTGDTYLQCENFLKSGRKVLFSGTPCQIAGLKRFLRKEYDNLLAVDVACHGVPSPLVWKKYLEEITAPADGKEIVGDKPYSLDSFHDIHFRDKSDGWRWYRFVLIQDASPGEDKCSVVPAQRLLVDECYCNNIYMRAFVRNLILRPSCYVCPLRSGRGHSDLTIADFWGVWERHPDFDDDRGTSLVLIHTQKGQEVFPCDAVRYQQTPANGLSRYNSGLRETITIHPRRRYFFHKLQFTNRVSNLIYHTLNPSFSMHICANFYQLLHRGPWGTNDKVS